MTIRHAMARTGRPRPLVLSFLIALALVICVERGHAAGTAQITVAGGCFWCVESDFEKVDGVIDAVSGYTGGSTQDPSYKQVTSGRSGHYEAVQITYDPGVISARELYDLFFRSVDPTDAGGQFCDRGNSYRTAIFASADDRAAAEAAKAAAQSALGQTIVTPVLGEGEFWKAEPIHQGYYKSNKITVTRFGPLTRANAYKRYREACGRDARVQELWGDAAPFIN